MPEEDPSLICIRAEAHMRSRLLLWTWLSALTHTPAGTALSHAPAALRAARRPRLASRRAVMQEAADQPEPDAGLAASLRARRDELERERAPPAVSLEPEHLEELLSELEGLRDWVSRDVAWAAMQRVREARSLDAFISELQAEVSELGDEIGDEIAEVGGELDARATALAGERRRALEERARPRVRVRVRVRVRFRFRVRARVKVGVRFRFRVGLGLGSGLGLGLALVLVLGCVHAPEPSDGLAG